jgi:thioredoxin-like negative regulator of GroEL
MNTNITETQFFPVTSMDEFNKLQEENNALLFYFSHDACNVCKVLKPKIGEMLRDQFPKMKAVYADTRLYPEIAGQNSIFSVPTLTVVFGGREYIRKSRNISIDELEKEMRRFYDMMLA